MMLKKLLNITLLIILTNTIAIAQQKKIYVYNWSEYIAQDTLSKFEEESGIKVVYDVFDSNEILEGKMISGYMGYNIVFPSSSFLARQIEFDIFQPINKDKLSNYKNIDKKLLKKLKKNDLINKYAIPYLWATTGIGFNVNKVKEILGEDAPINSWDLVLKPENLKKLSKCGVSFLDSPEEIFAIVLHYLGKDPNSSDINDYIHTATNFLLKLRPYIRYFHSSHYINDLANGNICVAVGWAGDILQIKYLLTSLYDKKNKNINNINYFIPKEGSLGFIDMIAIPKNINNIEETYKFINYLLKPNIIARITNKTFYANANYVSSPLINPNIQNNPQIYPPQSVISKLFLLKAQSLKIDRARTRAWVQVKLGK